MLANAESARSFARWDFSTGQRFSPSAVTRTLLARLEQPTEVVVLLPSRHPLLVEVRHTLDALQRIGPELRVRYVDPDRDTAEYMALAERYELSGASGESGPALTSAALLVRQEERRWFVKSSELSRTDELGRSHLRIEAALAEAIARIEEREERRICFVTGHGEKSIDDAADDGLLELRKSLEIANLEAIRTPLDVPRPETALADCPIVAVIGPGRPLPSAHEDALLSLARAGSSFLLFLDPIVGSNGTLEPSGLSRLVAHFGLDLPRGFVLERAAESRLPQGMGEAFLAQVVPHSITALLSTETARMDRRVVVMASQPIALAEGSRALPLLAATPAAVILDSLGGQPEPASPTGSTGPLVAAAAELPPTTPNAGPSRLVIAGTSALIDSHAFRDAALVGNRAFSEAAVAWVTERPAVVSVPDLPPLPAGLALTEESLSAVLRYVLLYMPGTALSLGAFVLLRRRTLESRSRLASRKTKELAS